MLYSSCYNRYVNFQFFCQTTILHLKILPNNTLSYYIFEVYLLLIRYRIYFPHSISSKQDPQAFKPTAGVTNSPRCDDYLPHSLYFYTDEHNRLESKTLKKNQQPTTTKHGKPLNFVCQPQSSRKIP